MMTVSDVMGLPGKSYGSSASSNTLSTELTVTDVEEDEEKLPLEPGKTLLSGVFLLSGLLATTLSLSLTHDRVPTNTSSLPDLVLDNLTYQQYGLDVSEILLVLNLVVALSVVLCHSCSLVILRRVWLVMGVLYYYRALTMFVTVLPKPDTRYECRPRVENLTGLIIVQRVLTILSGGGLSINGKHVLCGDYIFSGHTATLLLSYLVVRQCNSLSPPLSQSLSLRLFRLRQPSSPLSQPAAQCAGGDFPPAGPRPLHHRRRGGLLRHHQALVALPPRGREQQPPDSLGTQLSATRGLVECGQVIIRKFNLFYFTF